MSTPIQAPLQSSAEVKVFTLYLMEHIGRPLTFLEINEIVIQDGLVRPLDFCLAFPDLISSGHIEAVTVDGEECYTVTARGKEAIVTLQDSVLQTTREYALRNAVRHLNMQKTGIELRYTTERQSDGSFLFTVTVNEKQNEKMTVRLSLPTLGEVQRTQNLFERQPELIYRGIYALLQNRATPLAEYDPLTLV